MNLQSTVFGEQSCREAIEAANIQWAINDSIKALNYITVYRVPIILYYIHI